MITKIEIARWLLNSDAPGLVKADSPEVLEKKLKEEGLEKIYREIELPLIPILEEMRKTGIKADPKLLKKMSKDLAKELAGLEKKIYDLAGFPFNLNSPKQLSEVLFEKLKIDTRGIPKRKTGSFSTDAEALMKIKDRHPAVEKILKYRELFKIKSTYIEPLKELAATDKGNRIHTEFLQTGTATGRLSSQNPNLQNVPPSVREVFVAEKSYLLVSFDYSQIELRVLASVTKDPKMIEAFKKDLDIHAITAANVFNMPVERVTKEQRHFAKTLNFGVIYGMGPDAFARNTGLSREEAENFIAEYFSDFAEVKRWQEKTINKAREVGYVENLNGRKRWLPAIVSENRRVAAEAERAAINMPIQGLAADIIKLAMIQVTDFLKQGKIWQKEARLLLSIHDELLFEIKKDLLTEVAPRIKEIMEGVYNLSVFLKVDFSYGENWGNLEKH